MSYTLHGYLISRSSTLTAGFIPICLILSSMLTRSLRTVPCIGAFSPSNLVAGFKGKIKPKYKYDDMDAALFLSEMQRKVEKWKVFFRLFVEYG